MAEPFAAPMWQICDLTVAVVRPKVGISVADNTYHRPVAYERIKPEHNGAKNGGGAWMTRAEAKQAAKRQRRQIDAIEASAPARGAEDHWAAANAREAICEERWWPEISS
jgi:hypothetical protein